MPARTRCASRDVAVAGLHARQDLGEAQVRLAEVDLRLVIQFRRVRRAAGLVGDHRGVQRVDATETLAVEERPQGRQGSIGPTVALLRPGDQQRLQQLRQALPRQGLEPLFGRLPMAGAHLGLAQQQLRRLAVRQGAGELHCLGAPGDQARHEGLLLQIGVVRLSGERVEELRGRSLGIRLAHGEPARQVLAKHRRRRVPAGRRRRPGRRGIRCGTGRQQRDGEQKRSTDGADMLHLQTLRHVSARVMRI